jgi:hypothetical protein
VPYIRSFLLSQNTFSLSKPRTQALVTSRGPLYEKIQLAVTLEVDKASDAQKVRSTSTILSYFVALMTEKVGSPFHTGVVRGIISESREIFWRYFQIIQTSETFEGPLNRHITRRLVEESTYYLMSYTVLLAFGWVLWRTTILLD